MQNEPLFNSENRRMAVGASPDLFTHAQRLLQICAHIIREPRKKPGRSSSGGATGSGHPISHKKERRPEIFRRSFQSKSLKTIQQTFQSPPVEQQRRSRIPQAQVPRYGFNNAPRPEKESLTQETPMRRRNGHQMMTREPRRIKIPPAITLMPTVSCRKINASAMVNTTLSLSIGATLETSPVSSALK